MSLRTTNNDVYSLPFWNGHPYTVDDPSLYEQCVWYVLGRVGEELGYPMTYWQTMPNCSPNPAWNYVGVRHAKYWLENTRWKVSKTPVAKSVLVLDGYYGHVAFVEKDCGNGKFGISQYNKNSDRKFHYEEVDLSGNKCYGMKILGYLVLPIEEIKRDESKYQVKIKVDGLRIRADHSTTSEVIGVCKNEELFNVTDTYDGDYHWLEIGDGWIATLSNWVEEYLPAVDEETEKELDILNAELREKNKQIAYLKDMLNVTQTAFKSSLDKIKRLQVIEDKYKRIEKIVNE